MVRTAEQEVREENFRRDVILIGKQIVNQLNKNMSKDKQFSFRIINEDTDRMSFYGFIGDPRKSSSTFFESFTFTFNPSNKLHNLSYNPELVLNFSLLKSL